MIFFFVQLRLFFSKQTNLKNAQRNLNPTATSKITVFRKHLALNLLVCHHFQTELSLEMPHTLTIYPANIQSIRLYET